MPDMKELLAQLNQFDDTQAEAGEPYGIPEAD